MKHLGYLPGVCGWDLRLWGSLKNIQVYLTNPRPWNDRSKRHHRPRRCFFPATTYGYSEGRKPWRKPYGNPEKKMQQNTLELKVMSSLTLENNNKHLYENNCDIVVSNLLFICSLSWSPTTSQSPLLPIDLVHRNGSGCPCGFAWVMFEQSPSHEWCISPTVDP